MNKVKILIILFLVLLIQGCSNIEINNGDKIVSPKNQSVSLEGSWKVDKIVTIKDEILSEKERKDLLEEKIIFSDKYIYFNNNIIEKPEYKFKTVDSTDYFLYNYEIGLDVLDLKVKKVDIIIVTSANNYFFDVVQIDYDTILLYHKGAFLYLEKTSDNVEDIKIDNGDDNEYIVDKNKDSNKDVSSGVLLGLRSSLDDDITSESSYRTLWISATNREINPILKIENLFIPRKSGFWKMGVDRKKDWDDIFAYPIENKIDETIDMENDNREKERKVIHFISDDYVAVEYTDYEGKKLPRYKVIPIDNINVNQGILLSDIDKEDGSKAFINSVESFILSEENTELDDLPLTINEENFTMTRRNGYWILKGRIFYNKKGEEKYEDFNINISPSDELIKYNKLYLSWNYIKSRIPQAEDAYTSPNNDIGIIITESSIFVYAIEDNLLSSEPLKIIERKKDEKVVMAEWATFDYVELWTNKIKTELSK